MGVKIIIEDIVEVIEVLRMVFVLKKQSTKYNHFT